MSDEIKDQESILENQIGDMGGEGTSEQQGLGRLRNADMITGKGQEKLSDSEREDLAAFVKRSNANLSSENPDGAVPFNSISGGWIPVDRSKMGFRSKFYKEGWEFRVRPATVEAIKNWSAIDDTNPYVVNNVFNEIMKQCVSIQTETGAVSWQKINSWDRMWFILLVREYSFVNGESELSYTESCPECGNDLTYHLNADSLYYEFPDEDVLTNNWSEVDNCWKINPADYDVDTLPMIKLYCPTLEKDEMILKWAIAQTQEGHEPSSTLMRFLPWLVEKGSKDTENAKRIIEKAIKIYKNWDKYEFSFMDEVLKNIIVLPKENLSLTCPHCGETVHSTVRFPNGIKQLFAIQNRFKKFGSK